MFDDDLTDLSSGSSQRRFELSNDWENIGRFESITPTAWPLTPRLVYNWTRNEKIDFFFYAQSYEKRRRPPRNVREDSNFGNWIMDKMSVLFVRFVLMHKLWWFDFCGFWWVETGVFQVRPKHFLYGSEVTRFKEK